MADAGPQPINASTPVGPPPGQAADDTHFGPGRVSLPRPAPGGNPHRVFLPVLGPCLAGMVGGMG